MLANSGSPLSLIMNKDGVVYINGFYVVIRNDKSYIVTKGDFNSANIEASILNFDYSYDLPESQEIKTRSHMNFVENVCFFPKTNNRRKFTSLIAYQSYGAAGYWDYDHFTIESKAEKKTGIFGGWRPWNCSPIEASGTMIISLLDGLSRLDTEFSVSDIKNNDDTAKAFVVYHKDQRFGLAYVLYNGWSYPLYSRVPSDNLIDVDGYHYCMIDENGSGDHHGKEATYSSSFSQ